MCQTTALDVATSVSSTWTALVIKVCLCPGYFSVTARWMRVHAVRMWLLLCTEWSKCPTKATCYGSSKHCNSLKPSFPFSLRFYYYCCLLITVCSKLSGHDRWSLVPGSNCRSDAGSCIYTSDTGIPCNLTICICGSARDWQQSYNEYLTEKPATWKKHHTAKIHNVLFARRNF